MGTAPGYVYASLFQICCIHQLYAALSILLATWAQHCAFLACRPSHSTSSLMRTLYGPKRTNMLETHRPWMRVHLTWTFTPSSSFLYRSRYFWLRNAHLPKESVCASSPLDSPQHNGPDNAPSMIINPIMDQALKRRLVYDALVS